MMCDDVCCDSLLSLFARMGHLSCGPWTLTVVWLAATVGTIVESCPWDSIVPDNLSVATSVALVCWVLV
jgi:predicted membrane channel-forming protein YqfA (hemolysin III family)